MKSLSILSVTLCCFFLNLALDSKNDLSTVLSSALDSTKRKKVTSHIEYGGFLELCKEVESHRAKRLVSWKTFLKYANDPNTVILDTRSREKFNLKHIKGAVNLPFTEFSYQALNKVTGYNPENRILIYCNNNFMGDQVSFVSKGLPDPKAKIPTSPRIGMNSIDSKTKINSKDKLLDDYKVLVGNGPSLALNLPSYITLYGYGFKNVYELADLVHVNDKKVKSHLVTNTNQNSESSKLSTLQLN